MDREVAPEIYIHVPFRFWPNTKLYMYGQDPAWLGREQLLRDDEFIEILKFTQWWGYWASGQSQGAYILFTLGIQLRPSGQSKELEYQSRAHELFLTYINKTEKQASNRIKANELSACQNNTQHSIINIL